MWKECDFVRLIRMSIDWTKIHKKYKGLWVALASDEKTVLGTGKTAKDAFVAAKKRSKETPFLTRMPGKIVSYVGAL